ncbi:MAG: hypothetical protein IJE84_04275 [Clostridia bacterium]|nr:hypothetical protein [Clostridia bacterium]
MEPNWSCNDIVCGISSAPFGSRSYLFRHRAWIYLREPARYDISLREPAKARVLLQNLLRLLQIERDSVIGYVRRYAPLVLTLRS